MPESSRLASASITAGGAELGPGELLGAGPDQADRLAGRLRQPGGLDGALAGVLAAEPAAEVGDDHPDAVVGQAEGPGQLALDAERDLAPGPDRQLAVLPLGDGRPRLHRAVLDVGDVVRLAERLRRLRHLVGERVRGDAAAGVLAEVVGQLAARRVRARPPIGRSRRSRRGPPRRGTSWGAATPTKSPSRTATTPSIARAGAEVDRQRASPRRTAGGGPCRRASPAGRCPTGTDASPSRCRGRWAGGPTCRGPPTSPTGVRRDVGRDRRRERLRGVLVGGEVGVGERPARGGVDGLAVADLDRPRRRRPTAGRRGPRAARGPRRTPGGSRGRSRGSTGCRRSRRRRGPGRCRP